MVCDHGPTVLRVCRAVLGPVDADDAWSETFLSAMKAYPAASRRRERRSLAGDYRAPQSHRHHPRPHPARGPDRHRARDTERQTATHATTTSPTRSIALPDKQKQAVAYHYLAGLPYAEVAAILGGSADAARRAAADGIATLRRTYRGSPANGTSRNGATH